MPQNKKRHHFAPKFYLNGFTESLQSPILYVYQKGHQQVLATTSERVGYQNHFYTIEHDDGTKDSNSIENFLHDTVESPANPILSKIRSLEQISSEEKRVFSRYIVYFMKRVPRARKRVNEMSGRLIDETLAAIDLDVARGTTALPFTVDTYKHERERVVQLLESYRGNVPQSIAVGILNYPSPRVTEAIYSMTWQFLVCEKHKFYITSDNPVFFDEGLGIGNQYAEITFPISKNIALWITWRADLQEGFVRTNEDAVKEINRRTISAMTRYVFAPQNTSWLVGLVNRSHLNLSRLT